MHVEIVKFVPPLNLKLRRADSMKILPAPTVFPSLIVKILLLVPLLTTGNAMCVKTGTISWKETMTNAALAAVVLWEWNQ